MEYYSAIKSSVLPFLPTWLDLGVITLSEISQRKIDIDYFTYIWNKKKQMIKHNKTKQKQSSRYREQVAARGKGSGEEGRKRGASLRSANFQLQNK